MFHRHKWSKWKRVQGYRYFRTGGRAPTEWQERQCSRCGRTQLADL